MKNTNVIDCSLVRQYFIGKSQRIPVLLIIIGIPLLLFYGLGLILIAIGFIWYCINKNNFANEEKVDEMVQVEIEQAKERALTKLNLVSEQVSTIDPVSVYGPADQPFSETAVALEQQKQKKGLFGLLSNAKRVLLKNSDDPVYIEKVGSDSQIRYTLLNITTYMFGEDQLYIYYYNVDITTGLVFSEGTYEFFYNDITSISMYETKQKVKRIKKKKTTEFRIVKERMAIYTSGSVSYTASLGARDENAKSTVGEKFEAMRNLIRDKKTKK